MASPLGSSEPREEVWRCRFLKALVLEPKGETSLSLLSSIASAHPQVIHEYFTTKMASWMLEEVTYPWYDFVGATALFIASSYCRVDVCGWLIEHGANPAAECRFPGMSVSSERKTLNPMDVIGQSLRAPKPEDLGAVERLLCLKRLLQPPPVPRFSVKSAWHSWIETVPYTLSKFHVDDVVLCKWKGAGSDIYTATIVQVNRKESKDAMQTYRISFSPPDGGYYKVAVKKDQRPGEAMEVLYVFNDGKPAVPLYEELAPEDELMLQDGSIPVAEQKFRRVCFTELRAKITLHWEAFWIPSKAYCPELKHQLRYRLAGNSEWINVSLDVPRYIIKGLFLERKYEVQVRARNQHGWSELSKPALIIRTPNKRKGSTNKYPELESFGYVGRNNRTGAEIATKDDWEWWEANKPRE